MDNKEMANNTSTTYMKVKNYLMSTIAQKKPVKTPTGAVDTVWMTLMTPPNDHFNEVYPGIILGDYSIARDPEKLTAEGVTHVVNCANGPKFNQINTSKEFFSDSGIQFHGIPAVDILTYKMTKHFDAAATFIEEALKTEGKVYIHCQSGVSRSATIVLAFLMKYRNMTLLEAAKSVRDKRKILPNEGFLRELAVLNDSLYVNKEV